MYAIGNRREIEKEVARDSLDKNKFYICSPVSHQIEDQFRTLYILGNAPNLKLGCSRLIEEREDVFPYDAPVSRIIFLCLEFSNLFGVFRFFFLFGSGCFG